MPFKGDMRLGGPHDNERTLNGTSSDFDGVPAYGTFLSGPTDTSRNEADFVGTEFFMPYSTTVYANGLGGAYAVEVWGLQYFPAGWITNRVEVTSYTFEIDYPIDQLAVITYAIDRIDYIEDGTGINYESPYTHYPHQAGDVLATDTAPTIETAGPESPEIPEGSGDYYQTGVGRKSYFYDGAGGYYSEDGPFEAYYPAGTPIGAQLPYVTYMPPARMDLEDSGEFGTNGQYPNGKYQPYYWNGTGGYYLGGLTGSFFPDGTIYYSSYVPEYEEVQELNGQGIDQGYLFENGRTEITNWCWNGYGAAGTSTYDSGGSFHPAGQVIGSDGVFNYVWNGSGGYYQSEINPPDPDGET